MQHSRPARGRLYAADIVEAHHSPPHPHQAPISSPHSLLPPPSSPPTKRKRPRLDASAVPTFPVSASSASAAAEGNYDNKDINDDVGDDIDGRPAKRALTAAVAAARQRCTAPEEGGKSLASRWGVYARSNAVLRECHFLRLDRRGCRAENTQSPSQ